MGLTFNRRAVSAVTISYEVGAAFRFIKTRFSRDPLGMGFGATRFSSPGETFRLVYLTHHFPTALAETIIRDRFEDGAPRTLGDDLIALWSVATIQRKRAFEVVDIRDAGLLRLGLSSDIGRAKTQVESRAFSQALYDGFPAIDGILYRSRLTSQDCLAIYDRAVDGLEATDVVALASHADLIPALDALAIEIVG